MFSKFKFEVITNTSYFNPNRIDLYENGILFTPFSGATYSSKSVYSGSNGPENAFENTGRVYHSASESNPHWISINLGSTKKRLTQIRLDNRTDTHLPQSMAIYGSNDEVTWTPITTLNFETWTSESSSLVRSISNSCFVDSYYPSVSLLLPLTSDFKDYSTKSNSVSVFGNPTISSTQSKWGRSAYFNGSGDYLELPDSIFTALSNSPFTIETWIYFIGTGSIYQGHPIFCKHRNIGSGEQQIYITPLKKLCFYRGSGNSSPLSVVGTTTLSEMTWYHVALSVNGTTWKLFVNGIEEASVNNSTYWSINDEKGRIGRSMVSRYESYGGDMKGYLQDFRITLGIARYASNFTPPEKSFYLNPFYLTSLLLPFTGKNFSKKINDCSLKSYPITVYNNTKINSNQSKWEGGSGSFEFGDYLSVDTPLNIEIFDFTIECWIYFTNNESCQYLLGPNENNQMQIAFNQTENTISIGRYNVSWDLVFSNHNLSKNTWYHFAVTRYGSTCKCFINGEQLDTTQSSNQNYISTNKFYIGGHVLPGYSFLGNLQDFRILKGLALYTENFNVPENPFYYPFRKDNLFNSVSLLLPLNGENNSTSFSDKSSNPKSVSVYGNVKISTSESRWGDGSAYFDGSGDSLTVNSQGSVSGTENFTFEFWVMPTVLNGFQQLIANDSSGGFACALDGTGRINFGQSLVKTDGTGKIPLSINVWTHIAFSRFSGVLHLFINGSLDSSWLCPSSFTNGPIRIGSDGGGGTRFLNGYMQDIRITKGFARYTSNFDAPVEPFYYPQLSNLLLHYDDENNSTAILDSSFSSESVTAKGGAKISTVQSKFGKSSLFLNGSADYLELSSSDFSFGVDTFTIECFVYITSYSSYHCLFDTRIPGSNSNYVVGIRNVGGILRPDFMVSNGISTGTTTSVPLNTWTHVAFSRNSSGVVSSFVNGIKDATTFNYPESLGASDLTARIGYTVALPYSYFFSGYIDEFRILKGKSLYNSNFLPPTAPFDDEFEKIFTFQLMKGFQQSNPGKVFGSLQSFLKNRNILSKDCEDGGRYFVDGFVKINGEKLSRKVRLFCLNNGKLIQEKWSDPVTGYYKFDDLKDQPYYVWSEDYERVYAPVTHLVQNRAE